MSYTSNKGLRADTNWDPPKISAVQLSAAITACARIHMYQYISRPDCYYTDTDSAVLGTPLPEAEVSSIELGKLKLEHIVREAIFLAPKSYYLGIENQKTEEEIIKHKGAAKDKVTAKWFKKQFENMKESERVTVQSNFRIDWRTLNIETRTYQVNLGIKEEH